MNKKWGKKAGKQKNVIKKCGGNLIKFKVPLLQHPLQYDDEDVCGFGSFWEDGIVSHGFEIFFGVSSATTWAASFVTMACIRAITGPYLASTPSGVMHSKLSSKSNCSISKRDM